MKKQSKKPGKKSGLKWFMLFALLVLAILYYINKSLDDAATEIAETQIPEEEIEGVMPIDPISELDENSIGELWADATGLLINEENSMSFIIEANVGKDSVISLYENGELLGNMHDDGKDGDGKEGDGVFSYSLVLSPQKLDDILFHAEYEDQKSNDVVLKVYDMPTEDDVIKADELFDQLKGIEEVALVDGYVPVDKHEEVVNEMYDTALRLAEENGIGIEDISKDYDGITILFDSGLTYVYDLEQEGVLGGGNETYLSVVTLEPFINESASRKFSCFDNARQIVDSIEGASYEKRLNTEHVTFENIEAAFKPNSFIMWNGHGGYDDRWNSKSMTLLTGVPCTIEEEIKHSVDNMLGRVYFYKKAGRLGITYRYFNEYVDDLTNSFVYIGACNPGHDRKLFGVLCSKNAEVVLGYTDTVYTEYDDGILGTLVEKLCTIDETDGDYMVISKALYYAIDEMGEDDEVWVKNEKYYKQYNISNCNLSVDENGQYYWSYKDNNGTIKQLEYYTPSKPIYMGNPDYRINELIPKEIKLIDDLHKLSDIKNPISVNKIKDNVEEKIDSTVDQVTESFWERLNKALNKWLIESCGNC